MREATSFRKILLEAVDEGLFTFGESVKHVIYHQVERNSSIRRDQIPEKLDAFHAELENIFGIGVRVIEKVIAEKLCTKLSLPFREHENWALTDYACNAEKHVKAAQA